MSDQSNEQSLSSDSLPSSFDDTGFFEERRFQKLWRRLKEEPLIPVGCLATSYALYQASKSIRSGDHHQANKMFRARIYAQGFTLVALLAGTIFYKDDRLRRKKFETAVEEKKAVEKRDKWLRELEARDDEDRAWRARVEGDFQRADDMAREARESVKRATRSVQQTGDEVKKAVEDRFSSKSVREQVILDGWGPGMWIARTHEAWKRM